jgi:hypothetical protein
MQEVSLRADVRRGRLGLLTVFLEAADELTCTEVLQEGLIRMLRILTERGYVGVRTDYAEDLNGPSNEHKVTEEEGLESYVPHDGREAGISLGLLGDNAAKVVQ